MNIIKIDNANNINLNNNIEYKCKDNKYKINILNEDRLILIINNIDCEININVYANFNLLLYGNINELLNLKINIYNHSTLLFNKITKNISTLENIEVNLNDEYSKIHFNNTYIGNVNSDTNINHNNNNTESNVINHALGYKSNILLDIKETVENNIKNCILKQYSKIYNIDNSNVTIKPILNTRDYTVNAFHSSVITNINKDDILYLMSRGINEDDSIKLIINGFLLGNIKIDEEIMIDIKEHLNI